MDLVSILVLILILALVFALIVWAIDQVPAWTPYRGFARAILALIFIILLLGVVFGGVSIPVLHVVR